MRISNHFMKKIFIILILILLSTSSALADNKDVFTPKEYVLTLEQLLNQSADEEKEDESEELKILWNQWHADVRNKVFNNLNGGPNGDILFFERALMNMYFYVDKYGLISDIIFLYIPQGSVNIKTANILKGKSIYLYLFEEDKHYMLTALTDDVNVGSGSSATLKNLTKLEVTQLKEKEVPLKQWKWHASSDPWSILAMRGDKVLTFPKGTQRTKVKVGMGQYSPTFSISASLHSDVWGTVKEYKADDFDDVESIKNEKE